LGSTLSQIAANAFDRRFILMGRYGSAENVHTPAYESGAVVRVAPEPRGAEIDSAAPTPGKGAARMRRIEAPNVEILHASIAVDVMLSCALA
jgi:hypothetical protein